MSNGNLLGLSGESRLWANVAKESHIVQKIAFGHTTVSKVLMSKTNFLFFELAALTFTATKSFIF